VLQQATALAEAGAHALLLETFTNPLDAALATGMAAATGRPVVACLTPGDTFHALEAAMTLAAAGAAGIGLNCVTPEAMLPACRALRNATNLPLWMKPSAGLPRRVGERLVYDMTPEEFADGCMELLRAGADFIGGCCGAGPAHIAALGRRMKSFA
jgi:methionine synthase I (cobalamin-dependent)